MVFPNTDLDINVVIAKNNRGYSIVIEDMGIEIGPSPEQINLSELFTQDEITSSDDLKLFVSNSDIIINDLDLSTAIDYISTNTLSLDPEEPIYNANKFYNYPIELKEPPNDGDQYVFNSTLDKFILKEGSPSDSGPQVFPLVWNETQVGKDDWITIVGGDSIPELGHILPFTIKITDIGIWILTTGNSTCEIHLYIEDTNTLTVFQIPMSQDNYSNYINTFEIIVPPVNRIRMRVNHSTNTTLKKLNITATALRMD